VQKLLRQLNSVPGVVGSMICGPEGRLVAHAFPPTVDPGVLERAATAVTERTLALQTAVGPIGTLDLRYASSRIIVKVMGGARVLFLCSPTVNQQLLAMSAAGVLRQMDRLERQPAAELPRPAAPSAFYQAVQLVEALIQQSGGDRIRLRGQIALKAGFTLDLVDADAPDDPVKLRNLKAAARAVLGQDL
jgi:predicted regulator of Ras-like GTPase activity (Roadblock/LC7/MglB family)